MKTLTILATLFSLNAFADYSLLSKGTKIECYGVDNQRFILNKARTMIKWETEGESLGYRKITAKKTDKRTYAEFTTDEVTLRLTRGGDSVYFDGDSQTAEDVDCK